MTSLFRDEYERRIESLQIIYYLQQNKIDQSIPAIRELLEELTKFVKEGKSIQLDIPCPELNKVIKGGLYVNKRKKCEVVLKHYDDNTL